MELGKVSVAHMPAAIMSGLAIRRQDLCGKTCYGNPHF